jgi:hypothetical protein
MINVVNTRLYKGPHKHYIGRGSPLGNLYSHKDNTKAIYKVESVEKAVECFEIDLRNKIANKDPVTCKALNDLYKYYKQYGVLNLACYCKWKGHESCHGDIIKKVLEEVLK